MPEFTSERSLQVRSELHPSLVLLVDTAIQLVDFSLIDGARSDEQQQALYAQGRTKPGEIVTHVDGVNKISKHQVGPVAKRGKAAAFDFMPYPYPEPDASLSDVRPLYTHYAGFFLGIAHVLQINIRWGGDWDGDFRYRDQSFHDLPHIELIGG